MRHVLRRLFRCRQGQHRDALQWARVPITPGSLPACVVVHTLTWVCVDCERRTFAGWSDNLVEERRAGRIA